MVKGVLTDIDQLLLKKKNIYPIGYVEVHNMSNPIVNIHPADVKLNDLAQRYKEIHPDEETVMVCRSGNRSAVACEFLYGLGYRNVKNMIGGMNAWEGDVENV
jgi:rhodanese-related sulfurtransferase